VGQERARGAGHRIKTHRTKMIFEEYVWNVFFHPARFKLLWSLQFCTHKTASPVPSRPDPATSTSSVSLSPGARLSALSPFRDKAIYLSIPSSSSSASRASAPDHGYPPDLAGVPRRGNARLPSRLAKACLLPGLVCCCDTNAASAVGEGKLSEPSPVYLISFSVSLLPALSSAASLSAIVSAEAVCGYGCPQCRRRSCCFQKISTSRSHDL
jgi:hypothetical protein